MLLPQGDIPMSGQGEGAFGAKITGVPGGTVPVRYGEAKGIFSFEKRMSPRPPKEKRGGVSISPRTPVKRHKGAGCGPPLWKPFLGEGGGPRLWKPLLGMGSGSGKGGRGGPLCTPMNAAPTDAGTQLFEEHLSAQPAGDFWILPAVRTGQPLVLDELTATRSTHP